jgi:hypothetical protein
MGLLSLSQYKSITLQPVRTEGESRLDVAAGVEALTLKPARRQARPSFPLPRATSSDHISLTSCELFVWDDRFDVPGLSRCQHRLCARAIERL